MKSSYKLMDKSMQSELVPYMYKIILSNFEYKRSKVRAENYKLFMESYRSVCGDPSREVLNEFQSLYNDPKCEEVMDLFIEIHNVRKNRKTAIQSVLFDKEEFNTKTSCIGWMRKQNRKRVYGKKREKYPKFTVGQFVYPESGNRVPKDFYDPPDSEREKYHRFRQFNPDKNKEHRISDEIDDGVYFIYEY